MALVRIQVRRDTAANWTLANPVLAAGEPGMETDSGQMKVGDGIRNWAAIPYVSGVSLGSVVPSAIGTAAAGVSAQAARADHSHALPANITATSLAATGNASVGGSLTVDGDLVGGKHKHATADINGFASAVFTQLVASIKAGANVSTDSNPSALTLTINSTGGGGVALSITRQPVDAVAESGAATFSASASGGAVAATYQWQVSSDSGATWASMPNAIGDTLALTSLTAVQNRYQYRLQVTAGSEIVYSQSATLVTAGLAITAQPPDANAAINTLVQLSVGAQAGGATIAYQWQTRDTNDAAWVDVGGATQSTYSFTASTATGGSGVQYRASVTALGQTLQSRTASVIVTLPPLAFTSQPADTTDVSGAASFTAATAGGLPPVVFQWQRLNGDSSSWTATDQMQNITAGATGASGYDSATLSLTGLTGTQHLRRYRVVATDADNQVAFSTIATLSTLSLKITQQPAGYRVAAGATAVSSAFSVAATADGGVTYQWQSATSTGTTWTNISGATSATYGGFTAALVDDGKRFRCVVTGDSQSLPSEEAALTVTAAPFTITTHPAAATASGGAATFSFAYSGGPSGSPVIAWEYADVAGGWVKIAGATTTTLSVTGLTPINTGRQYRAIVSLGAASAITNSASVSVPGVVVFRQPVSVSVIAGATAEFTFDFTPFDCPTPAIQWQVRQTSGGSFQSVSGATSKTLSLAATAVSSNGYSYRAAVTCSGQVTYTSVVTLTVEAPPLTISSHPQSVTATTGTASFTFAVTGGPAWTQTILWQTAAPGGDWVTIAGATLSTLSVTGLKPQMNGTLYRAIVSRTDGASTVTATTNEAVLTVPGAIITLQPVSTSAASGAATFTMDFTATSCPETAVQWQKAAAGGSAWQTIASATSKTLTLTALLPGATGTQYRAAVFCGTVVSYTSAAVLTVPSYEFFLSQPSDVSATEGDTLTLSFTSDLLSMYPSSWETRRVGATKWVPFSGDSSTGTSVTFTVSALAHHNTQYRAVIDVSGDKAFTRVATVTVGKETSVVEVPSAFGSGLIGVAYGKGAYVTISSDATVLARRSTDGGFTWSNKFLPATKTWDAIVSTGSGDLVAIASGARRHTGNWTIGNAGTASGSITYIPNQTMTPQLQNVSGMVVRSTNGGDTWSAVSLPFPLGSFVRAWSVRWPTQNTIVMFYRGPVTPAQAGVPLMPVGGGVQQAITFRNSSGTAYRPAVGSVVSYANMGIASLSVATQAALGSGPFDVPETDGPLYVATSTDGGLTWASAPVVGMTDTPQQIAVSPTGIAVAVTGAGTFYNNVPSNGNAWNKFSLAATATTGYVRTRQVPVDAARRAVLRQPWRPTGFTGLGSAAPFREPSPTTRSVSDPITNHDANVVAWVTGSGFVAGCDKYAVAMISQDGINWGGAASSRVIGEVPLYVVDGKIYGVDTDISGYEKLIAGDSSSYPDFVNLKLGVTGLTDTVNCWAHSPKEVLLLETGNRLTYIPRDDAPVSEAGTPGAPTALEGLHGLGLAALSWTAPSSSGASAITNYIIEYSADSGRSWQTVSRSASTATTATVTGLTNYTQYLFRVSAVNGTGTGAYSEYSAVVTPKPLVPGAPTGVSAVPTGPKTAGGSNTQWAVSWVAPTSDGGSPITGYIVQSYDGTVVYGRTDTYATVGASARSYTTTRPFTFNDLRFPTAFRVIAVNAMGSSLPSTPSALKLLT